ncbi:abortive infection system antitoxin AbiGi family protein [Selenomonas ruminantium]|uniref:abortive infection system antitoxin AbiGi family protein n=1 Tax=Selenomonas ruminantium TaxID=971 RepID=UPI000426B311|nr:abortive infection system antitoxin AbiGi family protein [Selenomonas ruminantium]
MDEGTKFSTQEGFQQSANVLFNFMKKIEYLMDLLKKKYIPARYCEENIEYLDISDVKQITLPMRCFCDIKLGNISTHKEIYGNYAIGLTKPWGEENGIQPIIYVNDKSELYSYIHKVEQQKLLSCIRQKEFEDSSLNIVRYIKPIRGPMKRKDNDGEDVLINCVFHDEKEWRFIPRIEPTDYHKFPPIMEDGKIINELSNALAGYENYALPFEYTDIRYFLLNDHKDREQFIDFVMNLPAVSEQEKYLMISKIVVFEEEREDW